MKKILAFVVLLAMSQAIFAIGLDGKKAAYQGGTEKEKYFPASKKPVEGILDLENDKELQFKFTYQKQQNIYTIPYDQIIDMEYGQKVGRRVGAAVATAILLSPIGLFLLFSKKRKHYITIGYNKDGKEEVAVFELGKDIVRTTLPILEARSGKKFEYQDEEAKKGSKGK